MKRIALLVSGAVGMLLGGLWLLQGLGIVRIRPILCFANCAPIQGPSTAWAIVGTVVFVGGVVALRRSRPHGARHRS